MHLDALKATYAPGRSWADPDGGGVIEILYSGVAKPMRDELRLAGDAAGYGALKDTWLGKFFLGRAMLADFILMPVRCAR